MVKTVFALLLVIHLLLAVWAVVGFIEFFWAQPLWGRVSNPLFPGPVLFLQWALTLTAALVFIGGYFLRWPFTPQTMAVVYGAMASLCAVQTFSYMQNDSRFVAMGLEYLAYAAILAFLFQTSVFQAE